LYLLTRCWLDRVDHLPVPSLHRIAPMTTVLVWQASALAALAIGVIWCATRTVPTMPG